MTKTIPFVCAGILLTTIAIFGAAPQNTSSPKPDNSTEAARLNNLGVAYMNQQLFEKALKAFEQAAALDPKFQIAQMNQGVALLNLGRVDAARQFLEQAVKQNPNDPHAGYNLGMLEKNSANSQAAVGAFRRVTEIDANDADTWYFLGAAYAQNKQSPEAIDAFQHALKLNSLHASAEFGLSRAYQQSADLTHAREHLTRFQYITQSKLGSPISLAYGEQGKYSLAEESPVVVQ
jgi:tetratricopeptide (TPR) repeat protein